MPKAYWIAHVTITDSDAYAGYQAVAPEAFRTYGACFLARGGEADGAAGHDQDGLADQGQHRQPLHRVVDGDGQPGDGPGRGPGRAGGRAHSFLNST